MKADLKKKWVEALRSGKYIQGRVYLAKNGKHCCLGVLCEVAGEAPTHVITTDTGEQEKEFRNSITSFQASLRNELGLSLMEHNRLINMNDGEGIVAQKSFSEIADYIEKHIPVSE